MIFRHGQFKNYTLINPHASKSECEEYISNGEIYGCGKPFMIVKKDDNYVAEKCNYI
jgi:hypothetical protein